MASSVDAGHWRAMLLFLLLLVDGGGCKGCNGGCAEIEAIPRVDARFMAVCNKLML